MTKLLFALSFLLVWPGLTQKQTLSGRILLYEFSEGQGDVVRDRSGVAPAMDLKISDPAAIRWDKGLLEIRKPTQLIASRGDKLFQSIRKANAVTVEAWVHPADLSQNGPARILTFSTGTTSRNVTLGQDGGKFDVRLRTTRRDKNGLPSVASPIGSLKTSLQHVVYTRDRNGTAAFYIDGQSVTSGKVDGDLSNWDASFRFALANEFNGDRPWLGAYYRVAVYARSLSAAEISVQFKAGPGSAVRLVESLPVPPTPERLAAIGPVFPAKADGLLALYNFSEGEGEMVIDRSSRAPRLDLKIINPAAVSWENGGLRLQGKTIIRSQKPAQKISDAVGHSGSFSLEAWLTPANSIQKGPARIVTISKHPTERSLTLGQENDRYDFRFRTSETSANGLPSTGSAVKTARPKLTHVCYTRSPDGRARIYIDGKLSGEQRIGGVPSNWDKSLQLAFGNEMTNDRPWQGTLHLVALFDRVLSEPEVADHFAAGPEGNFAPSPEANAGFFLTQVAPLLSRHCLECHDASTRKGKVNLAHVNDVLEVRKQPLLVPGEAKKSLLWQVVADDSMPEKRPPLMPEEKLILQRWIDGGAEWPLRVIDPAAYLHQRQAGEQWIQRLTVPEYIATMKVAVGVDLTSKAKKLLPPDLRADGFANTAYNLNIDLQHIEAYAQLAELAVERMDVPAFLRQHTDKLTTEESSLRLMVSAVGKWILRGPLEAHEVDAFMDVATAVTALGGTAEEAGRFVIQAMLQAPRFLYRIENQRTRAPSPCEFASRMSYVVWGAPPDRELMQAADKNALRNSQQIETQVKRMLADPRSMDRSVQFLSEWLHLDRLDHLKPTARRFAHWNPALADDMRRETVEYFKEIIWRQKRPMTDLFNAQITFLTPRLARHYRLESADRLLESKQAAGALQRVDLKAEPSRGGLLTQGSLLTMGGDEASMVTRGLFVLHDVLRGVVKNPPPGLDVTPIPSRPGASNRVISESRIEDKACGGCHEKFEPLAFGLEMYDGLGAFHRRDEHGNTLRQDGNVLFPGDAKAVPFRNSSELMQLLASSPRVAESINWKLAQFALGRPLVGQDVPHMTELHSEVKKRGGTYQDVVTALLLSPLLQQ